MKKRIYMEEPERDDKIHEGTVKQLTGGDGFSENRLASWKQFCNRNGLKYDVLERQWRCRIKRHFHWYWR